MQSQSTLPAATLDEQRALADRERGRAADPEEPWSSPDVGLVAREERRPTSTHSWPVVVRNVLPRVLADRAGAWRFGRLAGTASRRPCRARCVTALARAAPRTRRGACAGTCRPAAHGRAGSRSRRQALQVARRASSGCRRRRRCAVRRSRRAAAAPCPASPARGGSTITTSGSPGALAQLAEHLADVAGEEGGVADRVQLRRSRSRRRPTPR